LRQPEDGYGRAVGRETTHSSLELRRFSEILAVSSENAGWGGRGADRDFEAALMRLGFQAKPEVVAFLASLEIGSVAPLHLKVARRISAEPAVLARLAGLRIDEFQLELMGFEHLMPHLTRRFFLSSRQGFADEERVWWAGLYFDSAVGACVLEPCLISSEAALIREGQSASEALRVAGIDRLGRPFFLEN
jgi:hypothetical protein